MRLKTLLYLLVACILSLSTHNAMAQEPWTVQQLMQPKELEEKLSSPNGSHVVIFDIGPAGKIKNAIYIGPAQDKANLKELKSKLSKLPKNTEIVIYCGCCPFEHCPNVRPAFKLLTQMQFSHARLLNLPRNLKADWIDKGYPMQD